MTQERAVRELKNRLHEFIRNNPQIRTNGVSSPFPLSWYATFEVVEGAMKDPEFSGFLWKIETDKKGFRRLYITVPTCGIMR